MNKIREFCTNFGNEFRKLAARGNALDLAVAIIMGTAFSRIVSSLVKDLVMPLLGILLGAIDLSGLRLRVGGSVIAYGFFLQTLLDFIFTAVGVFAIVKSMSYGVAKKGPAVDPHISANIADEPA